MNTPADASSPRTLRALTPLEARIVGVLIEKQHTVPDTYPLSLNALTSGCNQKTARTPVMNASEAEVLSAIEDLKLLSLVFEGSSSRVPRFEHNLNRVLGVPAQAVALLAVLMLRGAQTAAELRLNSARLHGFADVSSVEAFLSELAEREPPLVVKLPRAPGERESRWMHLLCGEVNVSTYSPAGAQAGERAMGGAMGSEAGGVSLDEYEALKAEQQRLADEIADLRMLVERMAGELGVSIEKRLGEE
ncbi:YceH family protein [Paraburkholderia sp. A2WS-5]|uniref:YceH family protein n=1 Tax=unclassified Paraburkholderia TaxID=2615204 RepID=UPI003B7A375A